MKQIVMGALITIAALGISSASFADTKVPQVPAVKTSAQQEVKTTDRVQLSEEDRDSIKFVVKMHIASLSQQRADLFSKTFTQKTQAAFDSPKHMLGFFSLRYIPVVFAHSFSFDGMSLDGANPVQHGYLIDKKGNRWRLSYGLQHVGNGDWRIISTVIEHAPGDPT